MWGRIPYPPGGVCGIEDRADIESAPTRVRNKIKITVSRLVAGPAPPFASLVKGRWPRRQARSEGLPRPEMPPPEAAATRCVCAAAGLPRVGQIAPLRTKFVLRASRLAASPALQFASLVKGRWPRRQARSEGLPRPEMPPPEAAATRKVPPCAAFRERLPAFKQSPSLRLSPQPAPFDKGAKPTRGRSRRRKVCGRGVPLPCAPSGSARPTPPGSPSPRFFPRGPAAATV